MTTRRIATAAAALLIILATAAAAALPPQFGGTASVRLRSKMQKIDPALATRPDEFSVVLAIYETLITRTPEGDLKPVLLEDLPGASSDGLTYSFKLRKNITFHDGTALDTSDVLHTIQTVVKSKASPYSWIFDPVKGTTAYRSGRATDISGFKIIDAQRFEIQLVKTSPNFIKYLSLPAAAIISSSNRDFRSPCGTGPFKFSLMRADGEIRLEYFKDYHEGRPYLDSIRFVVIKNDDDAFVEFKAGRLDIVDLPPDGIRPDDRGRFSAPEAGPMKIMTFLDINPLQRELSTGANRCAVSSALDRKNIVKFILNKIGQSENNTSAHKNAPQKIPSAARLMLWYPDTGKAMKFLAQKIQHDLAAAGLSVDIVPKQLTELNQVAAGNVPAFIIRSLPVPQDTPEALDKTLLSPGYASPFSTLGLVVPGSPKKITSEKNLYVNLYSQKTAWLHKNSINEFNVGQFDQIDFQAAFIGQ